MEKMRYPKHKVNRLCEEADGNKRGILRRKTLKRTPNKLAASVLDTHINMCISRGCVCLLSLISRSYDSKRFHFVVEGDLKGCAYSKLNFKLQRRKRVGKLMICENYGFY